MNLFRLDNAYGRLSAGKLSIIQLLSKSIDEYVFLPAGEVLRFPPWNTAKIKWTKMVLALLFLTTFDEGQHGARAWKGHDWDTLDRLHAKGYISDPKSKAKSVVVTEEDVRRSSELFAKYFGKNLRAGQTRTAHGTVERDEGTRIGIGPRSIWIRERGRSD